MPSQPPLAARRQALRGLGSALLLTPTATLLGGCGFHLRQPMSLPYRRIALLGFGPHSPMGEMLRASLPPGVSVVEPKTAEVVLRVLEDRTTRSVAASTSSGQVRELRLRVALRYRLTTPTDQTLVSDTELEQSRDVSYTETAALAKQTEEATLLREMRSDIVAQLLRMLATTGRQVVQP